MNYPLFLARRLSLHSSGRGSAPAVKVASAAVALSIIVMLCSISIVTGFKNEIVKKVIGFNADIQVMIEDLGEGNNNILYLSPTLKALLEDNPDISEYALQISVPAVFKTQEDFKGIYLRGISDSTTSAFIRENLEEGKVPANDAREVALSRLAANKLGLKTGDRIDTYFFSDDIRVRPLKVSGIFNTHFDSYDDVTAYTDLGLLQGLSKLDPTEGSSLKITVSDFNRLDEIAADLQASLDHATASGLLARKYHVMSAHRAGASYFQWLNLLDTNVVVILILMVVVGCVTLIGGMLMIILDKKSFIGLLKALGAKTGSVRSIFIYLALRVALIGMIIGNVLALGILWAQDRWHFLRLDPESYYIDFVPISFDWTDFILLNAGVLVISYLTLILPSRFVAGISPAETMRYE